MQAKFNYDKAKEFHQKMTDGTIQKQRPDGPEMLNAMNRATIDHNGDVNWTELCYCPTPFKHERATVYDTFFTELKTEPIEEHQTFEGKSFMDKLSTFTS